MPAEQRWAERRRSTALILLALFIVATALVLQPEGPSGAWNRVELVARAAVTRPCRQEPCERDQAVLASGYVQPVSGGSNERAIRNVVSQALTNAGGQRLNSAVGDAVRTHLLARNRPMPSLRESAKMASVVDAASAEQEENLMMSNLADVNPDRVLVKMFLESNCPSCRQFTRTCMANIMNADGISEIMDFEYISFGYGTIDEAVPEVRNGTKTDEVQLDSVDELKPVLHTIEDISMRGTSESMKPAITVACPHGSDECISDMYQACVQDVSPTQKEAFAVFLCMEDKFCGAASGTRGEQRNSSCGADPGETAHACLMDVAPHLAELVLACIKGDRKRELLVMNDIATIDARPQFLPWLTVDGRALGMSEQFLLGKHICNAYVAKTGKDAPESCLAFPWHVEELGARPFDFFDVTNFTQRQELLKQKHRDELLMQKQADARLQWFTVMGKIVLCVGIMAAAVFGFFKWWVWAQPEPEHTSFADRQRAEQDESLMRPDTGPVV